MDQIPSWRSYLLFLDRLSWSEEVCLEEGRGRNRRVRPAGSRVVAVRQERRGRHCGRRAWSFTAARGRCWQGCWACWSCRVNSRRHGWPFCCPTSCVAAPRCAAVDCDWRASVRREARIHRAVPTGVLEVWCVLVDESAVGIRLGIVFVVGPLRSALRIVTAGRVTRLVPGVAVGIEVPRESGLQGNIFFVGRHACLSQTSLTPPRTWCPAALGAAPASKRT